LREIVLTEIKALLEQQPLLTSIEHGNGIKISGKYKICNQIDDEVFEDYFALEIFVPDSFPDAIPVVKTTDGKIRANNYKGHVYPDGQFCLEIDTAITAFLKNNSSLLAFLTEYLNLYLCGFLYYQKHKRLPFGEHEHGIFGLMDYYCELFQTTDIRFP
jgi:ubiquitin-protein ligase